VPKTGFLSKSPDSLAKDFIKSNVISALLAPPRQKDKEVDFLHKKNYGQVPSYISKRKEEINSEFDLA
jgi:hypothetical protein